MITAYKRPKTTEEALGLLMDLKINPVVLTGGTYPDEFSEDNLTAIDLQEIGFDQVIKSDEDLSIGGLMTLQRCADSLPEFKVIEQAVVIEGGRNIRNSRTLHQQLFFSKGRSALASLLLAMDPMLELFPEADPLSLPDFFSQRAQLKNRLIKRLIFKGKPTLAFESIARSPLDLPLLIIVLAAWHDGRIRAVIGGFGEIPQLVYDGKSRDQLLSALEDITKNAEDQWASAEYRQDAASILARRCLVNLSKANTLGEV